MGKNLLLFLSLALLLTGCNFELRKGYGAGASSSIPDSKKLGVFMMEYRPVAVHINDTIDFNVYEAYAEIVFFRDDTIRKIDQYQILMHANVNKYFEKMMDTSAAYWYLDNFTPSRFGVDITEGLDFCNSKNTHSLIPPDTLKVDIMMCYANPDTTKYNTSIKAGEFYVIKK
ncbi:MAG: hypothetical protein JWO03_1494 [Bacteroidetes bacterium]|nr:hypothetical protein [Bacteroidota bacterium]